MSRSRTHSNDKISLTKYRKKHIQCTAAATRGPILRPTVNTSVNTRVPRNRWLARIALLCINFALSRGAMSEDGRRSRSTSPSVYCPDPLDSDHGHDPSVPDSSSNHSDTRQSVNSDPIALTSAPPVVDPQTGPYVWIARPLGCTPCPLTCEVCGVRPCCQIMHSTGIFNRGNDHRCDLHLATQMNHAGNWGNIPLHIVCEGICNRCQRRSCVLGPACDQLRCECTVSMSGLDCIPSDVVAPPPLPELIQCSRDGKYCAQCRV